jgi:type II secretory pathway predicted ATPase ExeA
VSNGIEPELDSLSAGLQYPDPFGPTANLAAYVPCEAMEQALSELVQTVRSERRAAAISGPPGLGKTLLLHLLADRLSPQLDFVYIPYAALPPEGLCTWTLDLLRTRPSDDPIAMLKAYGEHLRLQGSALLLLIDDAGALPVDSARMLGNLVAASDGGLRLAVASADSPEASRALAALGSDINMIRLIDPMTEAETRRYLKSRLAMGRVRDSIYARFDDETMGALHRMSGGVPRRLNALASAVMRGIPSDAAAARLDGEGLEEAAHAPEPPPSPEPEPVPAEVTRDVPEPEPVPAEVAAVPEPELVAPGIATPAPEPEPVPVEVAAVPEPESVPADAATAPEPAPVEEPPPPGTPPRALPSMPHAVLVGAVVVAVLLGISILRFGPTAPPPGGESARPAAASRAAPERALPEPWAAAVPGAEEALPEVAPEPAATDEGQRIRLEGLPLERVPAASYEVPEAEPAPVASYEAPKAEPVEVAEEEEVAVDLEAAAVEEEAAATLTQPEVAEAAEREDVAGDVQAPPIREEVVTAVVEEEAAASATQPEVAEEEEVAVHAEAPPLQEEMAKAAVQPDLAGSAEEEPGEPEPPALESPAPVVSFPVQVNATPWATIEIDGRDFGETPLAGIPLPAGPHSFRARMPDGRVIERVVEVDAENRFVVFE